MEKRFGISRVVVALAAVVAVLVLCVADLGALAQNANSSTTTEESMHAMHGTHTPRRRRGRRRPPAPRAPAMDSASTDAGMQETAGGEQTDLSGTYEGRLRMTGGHDMSGPATLTITGNQFTLTGEGMNHSGRVYAVTTRSYTGASFFFTDLPDSTTNTPVVVTVRARKHGDRLNLSPVPGTRTRLTFTMGRR